MPRKMPAAERAARDAIAPYVRAGEMTQAAANRTIRGALALTENTVRSQLSLGWGSAFYYGSKVARARTEWEAAQGQVARRMKRTALLAAEIMAAVYKAVRAEYKTPQEIEREDAEAPLLAVALAVVEETAQAVSASSDAEVA